MEMQAVHYNREFGSYEEAKGLENGIMIISTFFVTYLLEIFSVFSIYMVQFKFFSHFTNF